MDVDVDYACFRGSLIVEVKLNKAGETERKTFSASKSTLISAASAIKQRIADTRRESSRELPQSVNLQLISSHPTVGITDNGLVVRHRNGLCKPDTGMLLPWSSLVNLSLQPTCFGRRELTVCVKTQLYEGTKANLALHDADVGTEGSLAFKYNKAVTDSKMDNETITWNGKKAFAEEAFRACRYMMATVAPSEEAEDARPRCATSDSLKSQDGSDRDISEIGLTSVGKSSRCCGGGVYKMFIPWRSVLAFSMTPPSCCRKGSLSIVDLSVTKTIFRQMPGQDLDMLVREFGNAAAPKGQLPSVDEDEVPSHSRASGDMLRFEKEGVFVDPQQGRCAGNSHLFIPWRQVEDVIIRTTCLGASTRILTSTDHSISVASVFRMSRFRCLGSYKQVWAAFKQVGRVKLGEDNPAVRSFNKDRIDSLACVLHKKSLRLVFKRGMCSRLIMEFDIGNIIACTSIGHDGGNLLRLEIQVSRPLTEVRRILTKNSSCWSTGRLLPGQTQRAGHKFPRSLLCHWQKMRTAGNLPSSSTTMQMLEDRVRNSRQFRRRTQRLKKFLHQRRVEVQSLH
jgi:hypothetical protein